MREERKGGWGDAVGGRENADGQRQRVDVPAHARMTSRRKDWKSISAESSVMSPDDTIKGLNLILGHIARMGHKRTGNQWD